MMLKLLALLLQLAVIHSAITRSINEASRSNVIIMHVNNLEWSDLGIHHNKRENENLTPNIDRLAYGGIILNHFYANGGIKSLNSGCYQRSSYGNPNLMRTYFERNGYHVNSLSIKNYTNSEDFIRNIMTAISHDNQLFYISIDFGSLNNDMKLPVIDKVVGKIVEKTHNERVLDNTIIIFLSLPNADDDTIDNDPDSSSPIESHYRRTAFIYSHSLLLPQRVSNQLIHISDILPTLVNATDLKWRTRDRIYIDGINQWTALNKNIDARYSIFGDNFYIENNWKLSYGTSKNILYNSLDNKGLELSESDNYDFKNYMKFVNNADINSYLDELTEDKVFLMRNRAKVHCNLNDIDTSSFAINIKCSRATPCLFDLQSDPCELDDKHEHEFDARRTRMRTVFEDYLENGLTDDEVHHGAHDEHSMTIDPILTPSGGFSAFLTLMITLFVFIFMLIFVACIKERCNSRRSVYVDKSKKIIYKDESDATVSNGVSTISAQIEKQQTRL
ncbi:hypothetical protein PVAND_006428 [Polypedilum vanderplanki]|uniref:Uncharacterized protein n=1 Tax=Polypedilum vanderplanki TaxID=319348 RepID=A0A9J6C4V6_POLVA|nr:hypothetical protein PVAND_006428 [Polypedilum vanderplanki]